MISQGSRGTKFESNSQAVVKHQVSISLIKNYQIVEVQNFKQNFLLVDNSERSNSKSEVDAKRYRAAEVRSRAKENGERSPIQSKNQIKGSKNKNNICQH